MDTQLASYLEEAPWPASKDELIDFCHTYRCSIRSYRKLAQELDDDEELYESIEDIWPEYPTKEDFLFNEDEY